MMETEHWKVLRKLEGQEKSGNHIKRYIEVLSDNEIVVSDFFIPSTYRDSSGKENKCYEVTKLGCDFLANKFTGEKGVLFTAKYVKRFHEMEHDLTTASTSEIPLGELASYLKVIDRAALRQKTPPHKIMEVLKMVSEQFGVRLPGDLIRIPEYQQMTLADCK